ncbi:hypothetical protein D3C87_637150 [compost metagenome]
MTPEQKIEKLFKHVRENGTYLERDFKTIGGMWTVDTWVLGDMKVQLMDEGYTQGVITDSLAAHSTHGRPVYFTRGGEQELNALYNSVFA